ncbi:MAG: hypothetical protein HC844_13955, partial [Tabrizicola sp.]|nr:hypothetical protein [Tabrizicola sp.]
MGKHKSDGKKKKGSQLVLRVDKAERDAFVKLCDKRDTSAAREIRRFMREWVAAHSSGDAQPDAKPEPTAVADETPAPAAGEPAAAPEVTAAPPKRK